MKTAKMDIKKVGNDVEYPKLTTRELINKIDEIMKAGNDSVIDCSLTRFQYYGFYWYVKFCQLKHFLLKG